MQKRRLVIPWCKCVCVHKVRKKAGDESERGDVRVQCVMPIGDHQGRMELHQCPAPVKHLRVSAISA